LPIIPTIVPFSQTGIADVMIEKLISGLPVVKKKSQIIGMITETDLFTLIDIIRSGDIHTSDLNPKVSFSMSTNVIIIDKETTLDQIIYVMKRNNIHTIPVCEKGTMVGIIGKRDVLKSFYNAVKSIDKN